MIGRICLTLLFLHSFLLPLLAQKRVHTSSPDGVLQLQLTHTDEGRLLYALSFKGQPVIEPSPLGLSLSKPAADLTRFTLVQTDSTQYNGFWKPIWGEVDQIRNHYHELRVRLKDKGATGIELVMVFRLFNDGLGFRYEFPEQPGINHFVVADEKTAFALTGDHKAFWIPGDYDTNEYLYNTTPLSEVAALEAAAKEKDIALTSPISANAVQTPLLMKTAGGLYMVIHEAALRRYPAMNLVLNKETRTLTAHLVPDAVGNKAYLQTPATTPWRTLIVSDNAAAILESKLVLNLNEPSAIGDASWVKPQKYIGMWWEMHVGKANWPLAGGKHGANTQNVKTYIDFAAQHGFDGVLVEGWNVGWEDWFGNWKEEVFDFVTPYPDFDIDYLSQYAQSKGVSLIMHHETSGAVTNYERHLDTAFRFMRRHGMNTVKTGYVGRIIPRGEHHDGQWMVNHYERVAAKAARYNIMVISHESVRPTGLHRTYPNWLASEAARGSEFHNAPTLGMTPEHTTILPFTRGIGGPMDFTPGFFHFRLNQFDSTRYQRIRSTLAKQLALYVTLYSPVQMAADLPENYRQHPDAFQFIVDVPVDWADTKVLAAEPGDYLAIARKEKKADSAPAGGEAWYLGAVTDEQARTLPIPLRFLTPGKKYTATIYRDADHASWETAPEAYTIETKTVTSKTVLTVRLAPGGGCAIQLKEK